MPEDQLPAEPSLPRPLPLPSWSDRLRALLDGSAGATSLGRVVAGVVALAAVAVGGLFMMRSPPPPTEDTLPMASTSPAAAAVTTGAANVVVHAAGAVAAPGVYTLPAGSRVTDLVAMAGGLAADADPDRINLAAVLVDGARIYVPRVGEGVPSASGDAAGVGGVGGDSPAEPVDLNTASASELDALPGIGPATAQAIIDYRETHGRFRSVDELLDVRGIGDAKLAELRPLVRV